jgi:hypothetical protein
VVSMIGKAFKIHLSPFEMLWGRPCLANDLVIDPDGKIF